MGAKEFNERLISLAERKWRIRHEGQLQRMDATCAGTAGLSEVFWLLSEWLWTEFCLAERFVTTP